MEAKAKDANQKMENNEPREEGEQAGESQINKALPPTDKEERDTPQQGIQQHPKDEYEGEDYVTALEEMTPRVGHPPIYECIRDRGIGYEYKCTMGEYNYVSFGSTPEEAIQETAKGLLNTLSMSGFRVPEGYGLPDFMCEFLAERGLPRALRDYSGMLIEFCKQFNLEPVQYELVEDTGGPLGSRKFTVKAKHQEIEFTATGSTKRIARQQAASEIYYYLKENTRGSQNFDQEKALARAHKRMQQSNIKYDPEHPEIDEDFAVLSGRIETEKNLEKRFAECTLEDAKACGEIHAASAEEPAAGADDPPSADSKSAQPDVAE